MDISYSPLISSTLIINFGMMVLMVSNGGDGVDDGGDDDNDGGDDVDVVNDVDDDVDAGGDGVDHPTFVAGFVPA